MEAPLVWRTFRVIHRPQELEVLIHSERTEPETETLARVLEGLRFLVRVSSGES
ncbi:hypothetical protein Syun_031012 [Stephania yunnanensis]|uniref:Uncharacterized protein n=1 Tax=Stephania yunnanensis TaxID=152371 RepID=A0AAP0DVT1_9MAGN